MARVCFGSRTCWKEQISQVGKQKMSSKQYNSPMAMYSEDVLEEIMAAKEGGKEADLNQLNLTVTSAGGSGSYTFTSNFEITRVGPVPQPLLTL